MTDSRATAPPQITRYEGVEARDWLQVLLLSMGLVAIIWLSTPLNPRFDGMDSDGRFYAAMAGAPGLDARFAHTAPWAGRVISPWIVSQMPGDDVVARFRVLAIATSILLLVLVFAFLRRIGFAHGWALLGMLLYAGVFWTIKFSLYSPSYIDDLSQVLIFLALWVMVSGWWWLLPVLIAGAAFQKESLVYLAPVAGAYYLSARGWRWRPLVPLGTALVAASVLPLLALRAMLNAWDVGAHDAWGAMARNLRALAETPDYGRRLFTAVYSGMGLLPLLVLARLRIALAYLRTRPWWLVMLAFGVLFLFGGLDKARLFIYMLPAWLVLGLLAARDVARRLPGWPGLVWLGLLSAVHLWLGNHLEPMPSFPEYLDRFVPVWGPTHGSPGLRRALAATGALGLGTAMLWASVVLPRWSRSQVLQRDDTES